MLIFLGAFLIVRGLVELVVVDPRDPSSSAADWGGPHYLGVLAVHTGPGVIAAVAFVRWWRRRQAGTSGTPLQPRRPSRTRA